MRPALNPLVLSLKESATLAINVKALALRKQGRDIVHFGFGQSPFPVPEPIQRALRENADKKDYPRHVSQVGTGLHSDRRIPGSVGLGAEGGGAVLYF